MTPIAARHPAIGFTARQGTPTTATRASATRTATTVARTAIRPTSIAQGRAGDVPDRSILLGLLGLRLRELRQQRVPARACGRQPMRRLLLIGVATLAAVANGRAQTPAKPSR